MSIPQSGDASVLVKSDIRNPKQIQKAKKGGNSKPRALPARPTARISGASQPPLTPESEANETAGSHPLHAVVICSLGKGGH